jgi:hypothetical protein
MGYAWGRIIPLPKQWLIDTGGIPFPAVWSMSAAPLARFAFHLDQSLKGTGAMGHPEVSPEVPLLLSP